MHSKVIALLVVAATSGCSAAAEPMDPVQCFVAMQLGERLAKAENKPKIAQETHERAYWYAEKVAALPASEGSDARVDEVTKAFLSADLQLSDVGVACIEQVDADPAFEPWLKSAIEKENRTR